MGKLEDILRDLWGEAYRAGINSENIKEVLWPEYVRKAKEQILSLIPYSLSRMTTTYSDSEGCNKDFIAGWNACRIAIVEGLGGEREG